MPKLTQRSILDYIDHSRTDSLSSSSSSDRKRSMSDDSTSSGGSPPKRLQPSSFDHKKHRTLLYHNYLQSDPKPVYPEDYFQKRYVISPNRFKYIVEEISKLKNHPFYKRERTRKETEPSIESKLMFAIGALVSGSPSDKAYFGMSEEMAQESCAMLDVIMDQLFSNEYLRTPDPVDLQNIRKTHKADRRIGLDVPKLFCCREWRANFKGDTSNSSPIVLKTASDSHSWIWHVEFGLEGGTTGENLRTLSQSPLPEGIKMGKDSKKGIGHVFYVLQSEFKFLQRMHRNNDLSLDQIGSRIRTCILLHNMSVSNRAVPGASGRYDPYYKLRLDEFDMFGNRIWRKTR